MLLLSANGCFPVCSRAQLAWVIRQTSCQRLLPGTSCVTHNTWQSNGQMGPVSPSRDGVDGGRRMNLRPRIDLELSHMRLYAAKQTRLKAPSRHFYGANSVAANGHTNTQTSWRTTESTRSTCCFLGWILCEFSCLINGFPMSLRFSYCLERSYRFQDFPPKKEINPKLIDLWKCSDFTSMSLYRSF